MGRLPGKLALSQAGGTMEVGIRTLLQRLQPGHTGAVWGDHISFPLQQATQNTQSPHFLRLLPPLFLFFCSYQPLPALRVQ